MFGILQSCLFCNSFFHSRSSFILDFSAINVFPSLILGPSSPFVLFVGFLASSTPDSNHALRPRALRPASDPPRLHLKERKKCDAQQKKKNKENQDLTGLARRRGATFGVHTFTTRCPRLKFTWTWIFLNVHLVLVGYDKLKGAKIPVKNFQWSFKNFGSNRRVKFSFQFCQVCR